MQRKVGLSLTEILVVVAILAILAGLGFSVSAPARESTRQSTCISNLKQIYTAWALYSADWPGLTYPNTEMSHISASGVWTAFNLDSKPGYLFCPDYPRRPHVRSGSSYALHMLTDIWTDPNETVAREMAEELERLGPLTTAAACGDHDVLYYGPREEAVAHSLTRRFEIRLRFDGSTAKVRGPRR